MGKKRRMLVAALVLAVVAGLAWVLIFRVEPEPVYQGKRLSKWLEDYTTEKETDDLHADEAVRHIGTNGIPTLLRMLRLRDSALTLKLVALVEKQHLVRIHYVSARARNRQAQWAFKALGPEARDAVPALMTIFEANISPESRLRTALALGNIGPDARAAVPLLLTAATDTNTPNSSAPNAGDVRFGAIVALGNVHTESELVVPALTKALSDPNSAVRGDAVIALRRFGPDAKVAIPALFRLLPDQDSIVRANAAGAIKEIDPETAALRKAELDAALAPEKQ